MFWKLLLVNLLTFIRVLGTIVLVPIYNHYGAFYAGVLGIVCYLTDSIDGFLARHLKVSTFFGSLFDGAADKLFTIMNFIVLYLITPYAIIPIIIELIIVLVQIMKYRYNYNVKSNKVGKFKTWVLAICVILTFLVSDINGATFISENIKNLINNNLSSKLYFWLLSPAIIMEFATLISYIEEIFHSANKVDEEKEIKADVTKGNFWHRFKNVWLSPEYYDEHKDDKNIRKVTKINKKNN